MKYNKRHSYIFIQENAFENFVSQMAAILSLPQCVNLISDPHQLLEQQTQGSCCKMSNIFKAILSFESKKIRISIKFELWRKKISAIWCPGLKIRTYTVP